MYLPDFYFDLSNILQLVILNLHFYVSALNNLKFIHILIITMSDKELKDKIKELEKENEELKVRLKKYTNPDRRKNIIKIIRKK